MNQAQRSDDYNTFAAKAARALDLNVEPTSVLKLFKVSGGALIQNDNITLKGVSRKWTLGNYLSLLKKSPSSIKIGIACVDDTCSTSDDESESPGSHHEVMV